MYDRITMPGRVNLIGEHIDYHNLSVLPMALERRLEVKFRPRADHTIRAVSASTSEVCEFEWGARLTPDGPGHWSNYVKAAAQAVADRWGVGNGIDAEVTSNLPAAAGLSSSSALLAAFSQALLAARGLTATFEEWMEVLPEGEHFVGTRGGGMDHAAVLAARPGHATLVHFNPARVEPIAVPPGWAILVAHSLVHAEKSAGVKAQYNSRRTAGARALTALGLKSFQEATSGEDLTRLDEEARLAFVHVTTEAARVFQAVEEMKRGDGPAFGALLNASHVSMRDNLKMSHPEVDALVEVAQASGAWGARLTGGGFGGCAVIVCAKADVARVREHVFANFYASRPAFRPKEHWIETGA